MWKRVLCLCLVLVISGVVLPDVAWAHDPVFVEEATPVEDSPLVEDGTISFATYGLITTPGEDASIRLRMAAGDELIVELLVPDKPPENAYDDFSHIHLTITAPDGTSTELVAGPVLERFDEPFSNTSYLRLIEYEAEAVEGVTEVTVSSEVPTRFTVATGRTEQFGTDVSEYERQGLDVLATWYETPPPAGPTATSPTTVPATTAPSVSASSPGTSAGGGDGGGSPIVAVGIGLVVLVGVVVLTLVRRRAPTRHP